MKSKIISLLVLLPCFLFSQGSTDTLWSVPQLDGTICYRPGSGIFNMSTSSSQFIPGDAFDVFLGEEVFCRDYLGFDLSQLSNSDTSAILSAFIGIYQFASFGNEQLNVYPIWNVAGGDTHFCVLDHIDYGSNLDLGDWTAGDPGDPQTLKTNIGIISDNAVIEYKTMDVTRYVKEDIVAGRNYNQYRMRFTINTDYAEGQVVMKVTTPFSSIESVGGIISTEKSWFNALAQEYQITELSGIFESESAELQKYYLAVFDSTYTVEEVVTAFAAEQEVEFAEPDYIFVIFSDPDPFFNLQWGLTKIQADLAWQIESGNSSVIVGVVDTGTDLLDNSSALSPHPDLVNNLWNENGIYGWNAIQPGQYPEDDNGHGTHVAGIIAAETNNNLGVSGMAGGGFGGGDGIRIMSVKAGRTDGFVFAHRGAAAIVWAADSGAHIINMSWGRNDDPGNLILAAIQHADSLGAVLVAAAGNENKDIEFSPVYPGAYEEVIAVAGTDINDLLSPVSNFGSTIEVCAPAGESQYPQIAENIYSTTPFQPGFFLNQTQGVPDQYAYLGGTSTAAAFVSGLAALLKSYNNNLSAEDIRNLITGTADPIPEQFHERFVWINAHQALSAL